MTDRPPILHPRARATVTSWHSRAFLLGYAVMGKGFAYFGYPPFFVGELAFLAGFVVLLRSGCLVAVFAFGPSLLLAATMGWTLLRTLPFVGTYGFDSFARQRDHHVRGIFVHHRCNF